VTPPGRTVAEPGGDVVVYYRLRLDFQVLGRRRGAPAISLTIEALGDGGRPAVGTLPWLRVVGGAGGVAW
jgi:hypothetical protein